MKARRLSLLVGATLVVFAIWLAQRAPERRPRASEVITTELQGETSTDPLTTPPSVLAIDVVHRGEPVPGSKVIVATRPIVAMADLAPRDSCLDLPHADRRVRLNGAAQMTGAVGDGTVIVGHPDVPDVVWTGTTNESGRVVVPRSVLSAQAYEIIATDENLHGSVFVARVPQGPIVLQCQRTASITLCVRGANDVAEVPLEFRVTDGDRYPRWRLTVACPDRVTLCARAGTVATIRSLHSTLVTPEQTIIFDADRSYDIVVSPLAMVRVVDATTGAAIRKFRTRLYVEEYGVLLSNYSGDEVTSDGAFYLNGPERFGAGLLDKTVLLYTSATGYQPEWTRLALAQNPVHLVRLWPGRGRSLVGTVTSPEHLRRSVVLQIFERRLQRGRVGAGARRHPAEVLASTRLAEDGTYSLQGLPAGPLIARIDWDGGYKEVEIAPAAETFDYELVVCPEISGRVVTNGGAAAPGVPIVLEDAVGFWVTQKADSNGRFAFFDIAAGVYRLGIEKSCVSEELRVSSAPRPDLVLTTTDDTPTQVALVVVGHDSPIDIRGPRGRLEGVLVPCNLQVAVVENSYLSIRTGRERLDIMIDRDVLAERSLHVDLSRSERIEWTIRCLGDPLECEDVRCDVLCARPDRRFFADPEVVGPGTHALVAPRGVKRLRTSFRVVRDPARRLFDVDIVPGRSNVIDVPEWIFDESGMKALRIRVINNDGVPVEGATVALLSRTNAGLTIPLGSGPTGPSGVLAVRIPTQASGALRAVVSWTSSLIEGLRVQETTPTVSRREDDVLEVTLPR